MMGRVREMSDIDNPNENTNDRNDFCQHVAEVVEFALERSLFANLGADGAVDVAYSSLLSGMNDNSLCCTINYGGSL